MRRDGPWKPNRRTAVAAASSPSTNGGGSSVFLQRACRRYISISLSSSFAVAHSTVAASVFPPHPPPLVGISLSLSLFSQRSSPPPAANDSPPSCLHLRRSHTPVSFFTSPRGRRLPLSLPLRSPPASALLRLVAAVFSSSSLRR